MGLGSSATDPGGFVHMSFVAPARLRSGRPLVAALAAMAVALAALVTLSAAPAQAAVAFQTSSTAQNGSATTLAIPRPAGTVAGNLLLAQVSFEKGSDAGSNAQLTPSGWTMVTRTNQGTDLGTAVLWRVATASEPASYTWTFGQSVKAAGGILRYTGVDTSSPVVAFSGNSGTNANLNAQSVTAPDGSRLVALYALKKATATLSTPGGMNLRYGFANPQDVRLLAADEVKSGSGGSGSRQSSSNLAEKWVANLIALRASVNGAPTVGSIAGPTTVAEGGAAGYSVSANDPDGDALSYAWSVQSGNAAISGAANSSTVSLTIGDGPSTVNLRVVVTDTAGNAVTRDLSISVQNVAPTATLNAPALVNEGAQVNLSLNGATDAASADVAGGFTYAFDCGSGFSSFGPASSTSCPTTDDANPTVGGRVRDKDGGVSTYTANVTVANVAPTATLSHDAPVDEGSPFTLQLNGASDPSSADTAAGFSYAFDCGDGAGFGGWGPTSSAACATDDNGTRLAKARVRDKDGDFTEYSATVSVANVAPSASFSAPSSVTEGDDVDLELANPDDPSGADSAAGFGYAFDCGSGFGAVDVTTTNACTTTDNGTRSVGGRISDKDGGASTYTASVEVTNVAPTGTFSPTGVEEGSPFSLTIADVSDDSSDDTAAGFEFAFDCGAGTFGPWGANLATCPTDDDGTRTVRAKVRDKDGGESLYTATVGVANAAPTATLVIDPEGAVDEGNSFTLALTDVVEPSAADLAAGLTYEFDCGDGTFVDAGSDTWSCATDDNTPSETPLPVRARISDKDGGSTVYAGEVTVANIAPEGTFTAPSSLNEGESIALALSDVTDPSGVDTAAGFGFSFDCGDGSFSDWSSDSTASCATDDNTPPGSPLTVGARVRDKDGGVSEYFSLVEVLNVAPTATFAPTDVEEGSSIQLALTDATDASSADVAAGFTYSFDCGDGSGPTGYGTDSSLTCPTDDDGPRTVSSSVRDKDGGVTTYSVDLVVHNVAPTATFDTTTPVAEGSPFVLSLTEAFDPSTVDAASLEYAFDCGDGLGAFSSTASRSCPTDDNGSHDVVGKIRDKDGGVTTYTAQVAVDNVAPTATFSSPSSVDEGSDIGLALTDPFDPSGADSTAGFGYAFDCGSGFDLFGTATTATCSTVDDENRTVGGRITDKDDGTSTYTASVTVNNVAPSATFNAPVAVDEDSPIALSLTDVTDPSGADTAAGFAFAFDCGAGYGAFGSDSTASCPTTDNGNRTVGGKVQDKDGGVREYTMTVAIANVPPNVVPPVGQAGLPGIAKSFALGSFSDAGVADNPWTVNVSWGDGLTDTFTRGSQGSLGSLSHTYALAGVYTVTVRVTDKDLSWGESTFTAEIHLTDNALLGNHDVEISGANSRIMGNVHANKNIKIAGSHGDVCGDLKAHGQVSSQGTQSCGTTTSGVPALTLPTMANYVPTTVTHTLTGDRSLNGYTCALPTGCVVKVTGKLELRGTVTGKVWFLVDKDVVVKGNLAPADAASKLRVYSRSTIDVPGSSSVVSGQFLAEVGVKLSGSKQLITGLYWGGQYVDMSGSSGYVRGAVVSNGMIKLAGSNRSVTYDASAITL